MKYQCTNCNSEIKEGNRWGSGIKDCPVCLEKGTLREVPEWETPEQYKERTGREWKGAVWAKLKDDEGDSWGGFTDSSVIKADCYIICANNDTPPPDDFGKEVGI